MAWLDAQQLKHFKKVGRGVKISSDVRIFGPQNIEVGDNVRIDAQTIILATNGYLKVGSHVHIAARCMLASGGGITIGDFAGLSFGVQVISASDDTTGEYLVGPQFPDFFRHVITRPTHIEDFAFLGAGSTILTGARIKQGAMIGASSLVLASEELAPWAIHFGVPTRQIATRKQDCVKKSIEMLQWWEQNAP